MSFGNKAHYGTADAQIEDKQIVDGGNSENPDAIGDISKPMDDERSKEETDSQSGYRCKPVGENAPRNVPNAQLQARLLMPPISGCDEKVRHVMIPEVTTFKNHCLSLRARVMLALFWPILKMTAYDMRSAILDEPTGSGFARMNPKGAPRAKP
jgi:hypothetical protein